MLFRRRLREFVPLVCSEGDFENMRQLKVPMLIGERARDAVVALAGVGILLLGIWLRLPSIDARPLWNDELWRINLILEPQLWDRYVNHPDAYTAITSPAYIFLTRLIASFNLSPLLLRMISFVPSVLVIIFGYLVVLRAGGTRAIGLLASLLIATNLEFIRYSSEFKPYMFEVFFHVLCIYAWISVVANTKPSKSRWMFFGGVLLIAILAAANVVFIIPAMFGTAIWKALRQGRWELYRLLSCLACLTLLIAFLYQAHWRFGTSGGMLEYWAGSFRGPTDVSYIGFIWSKSKDVWRAAFNAIGSGYWLPKLMGIEAIVITGILLFSWVWRHRNGSDRSESLGKYVTAFCVLFAVTLITLNMAGKWPFGAIRPNLFVYAHILLFVSVAMSLVPTRILKGIITAVPILLIVMGLRGTNLNQLRQLGPPMEDTMGVWESFVYDSPSARDMRNQCANGRVVAFTNPGMTHALEFLRARALSGEIPKTELMAECVELRRISDAYSDQPRMKASLDAVAGASQPIWVLYSHLDQSEVETMNTLLRQYGVLVDEKVFQSAGYIRVIPPSYQSRGILPEDLHEQ